MRKYILLALGMLLVINLRASAQVTKVGTTAAGFLGIDVGPRATGMGGAFVSLADDATAMYWNPAGIAKVTNFNAAFSNTKWIADLSFNYAGAVLALGNFGNLGVNATFLTMDQMERTTILNPEGTGEFFDAACYAFGLTYARNLTDQFAIGLNAKYINERYYHSTAGGFAIDVGALFDTKFYGLVLGMSISNYGTKMQLDGNDFQKQVDPDPSISGNNPNVNARLQTDPFDLPLLFRVGVSMDVLKGMYDSNLILSVDALHPSDDVEYVNIGGEYIFHNIVSLRAGYNQLFVSEPQRSVSFGGGIRYPVGLTIAHFDYSYLYFGVLKSVQTFSLGLEL